MMVEQIPMGCVLHSPEAVSQLDPDRDPGICFHEGNRRSLSSSLELRLQTSAFRLGVLHSFLASAAKTLGHWEEGSWWAGETEARRYLLGPKSTKPPLGCYQSEIRCRSASRRDPVIGHQLPALGC